MWLRRSPYHPVVQIVPGALKGENSTFTWSHQSDTGKKAVEKAGGPLYIYITLDSVYSLRTGNVPFANHSRYFAERKSPRLFATVPPVFPRLPSHPNDTSRVSRIKYTVALGFHYEQQFRDLRTLRLVHVCAGVS